MDLTRGICQAASWRQRADDTVRLLACASVCVCVRVCVLSVLWQQINPLSVVSHNIRVVKLAYVRFWGLGATPLPPPAVTRMKFAPPRRLRRFVSSRLSFQTPSSARSRRRQTRHSVYEPRSPLR